MFTIENVKIPGSVTTNTPYKVTGEIKLEGLLYVNPIPAWVVATVTYPTGLFSIFNTAEQSATALAWFGKFTLNFGSGFNQQGNYKLDIKCYAGPTFEVIEGVQLASVSVVIPPFPPIASYPTQQFSVSGSAPLAFAFNFGSLTITPSSAEIGYPMTLSLPVQNTGADAQTVKIHLDVTETGPVSPGSIVGSQDFGPYTIQPGASQTLTWNWTAAGAITGKWLVATLYQADGVTLGPNVTPNNPWIYKQTFNIISTPGGTTGQLVLTLNPPTAYFLLNGSQLTPSTYQITPGTYQWTCTETEYASQSGTIVINQAPPATVLSITLVKNAVPVIQITNTPIAGGVIDYTLSGFDEGATVYLGLQGVANLGSITTGGSGSINSLSPAGGASGDFPANFPAGAYTMIAWYADGTQVASVNFTIAPAGATGIIIQTFTVYVANWLASSGYTYYQAEYYDEVTAQWVTGNPTTLSLSAAQENLITGNGPSAITFTNVHNVGGIAVWFWNGTTWSNQITSPVYTLKNGEQIGYDLSTESFVIGYAGS